MVQLSFEPEPFSLESVIGPSTSGFQSQSWVPVLQLLGCEFKTEEHFGAAMLNLILHPNINSSSIMRADILYDSGSENKLDLEDYEAYKAKEQIVFSELTGLNILKASSCREKRRIVRDIIPRNPDKDLSMRQTCMMYEDKSNESEMVLYLPHGISQASDTPYYHPAVAGVLITYGPKIDKPSGGENSLRALRLYYRLFPSDVGKVSNRLTRTGLRLLTTAHRHSLGVMNGYKKRVQHDVVVDKLQFQDRYIELKRKYARNLVSRWVESTDPKKHVFEDLSIAAFLMLLWEFRLTTHTGDKPKFVDIGCGNGVLVYVLIMEGYEGYGIDARRRKTWDIFPEHVQECLHDQVLIPDLAKSGVDYNGSIKVHNGIFDKDVFLIGNHSDELTPWIPLFDRPFIVIPCCSHAFSGAKHRYPTAMKHDRGSKLGEQQTLSTYGALVEHVARTSHDVGWVVEREMLRIPSTRNAAIIGIDRRKEGDDRLWTAKEIVDREGGAGGFYERVSALTAKNPRSH
ncbi:hypothetical protein V1512DRAFT_266677 [Lipomyces arxii]|uniref:uncharacterized protein n=1 Tax=Lipomyces arxii TaxID=56418 RepID=UPI0034CEDD0C